MSPIETPQAANEIWVEGPAVLRLRMLELKFGLQSRRLTAEARASTEQAMRDIRQAVLDRPPHSFADIVAKLQTARERDLSKRDGGTIFG